MKNHNIIRNGALLAAMAFLFATGPAQATVTTSTVFISEFHYDNSGTDAGEFIEIAGPAGTNLSGWSLVLYNGANNLQYNTLALSGTIPNQSNGYGTLVFTYPVNGIQNGAPDGIALVTGTTVVEFISYEGAFTAADGPATGSASTDIGVSEGGTESGTSLKRTGTGLDNVSLVWSAPTAATPGSLDFTPGSATVTDRTIPQIQGAGAVSPHVGTLVRTTGVVTGVFPGLGGFYIQDASGDGDAATSDGIFIASSTSVTAGQLVQVEGSVGEEDQQTAGANGETMITASNVTVLGAGSAITPTAMPLPEPSEDFIERYEGMLIAVQTADSNRMRVAQTYFLGRYGQLTLSSPNDAGFTNAMVTPTQLFDPSTSLTSPAQLEWANQQRRILVLDDGQDQEPNGDNPATVPYIGCTESGTPASRVIRAGDFAGNLVGILDWGLITTPGSSNTYDYRLQPTNTAAVTFTVGNPRPTQPPNASATYEVVGFNVYNYFTSLIRDDSTTRGAYDGLELRRQTEKLVAAIGALNADVLGLVELENNAEAIDVLVNGSDSFPGGQIDGETILGLNDVLGAGTYAYIQTGVTGGDRIKVGFIYKPSTTLAVGNYAVLPATVNGQSSLLNLNRPSIAQSFQRLSNGQKFTVAVNHFKSKGSSCAPADPDLGDLAGNCNLTRLAIAQNVVNWLASDPTASNDPDYLIIGDLNSYAQEAPIDALRTGGFVDLVARDIGINQQQDYVFDGRIGNLGYALASTSMANQVLNTEEWHINSDEAKVLDFEDFYNQVGCYDPTLFRSADHDPVSLSIGTATPVPASEPYWLWMIALTLGAAGFVCLSRRRVSRALSQ